MVTRLGPEFLVNTYTTSGQDYPSIATDSNSNFIITWESNIQDGDNYGIYGRRYDSNGNPVGTEFQVNTYTTNVQGGPSITADANGNFIITWDGYGSDADLSGIYSQRYDSNGNALGTEFQVNTYTTMWQGGPSIATDLNGNFIIAWNSDGQDGDSGGVYVRRYDTNGNPLGTEFQVNTYTTNGQGGPSIATDPNGNFIVAWNSDGQDGASRGVYGRRYDSNGNPVGTEFQVNTYTTSGQSYPSIATDPNGNFIIAWESYDQDGDGYGIYGRRYDSNGNPLGTEFQVNTYTTSWQYRPSIATDPNGNFIIAWHSLGQDGSGYGIYGQQYDSNGTPVGSEFRVNTYITNDQRAPSIATDPNGNFIIAWSSNGQDGDSYGIYAQRFGTPDVTLITATPSFTETTPITIAVNLNGTLFNGDLPINFQLAGTANYTNDYLISSNVTLTGTLGTIVIPNGSSSTSFTLTPIDDTLIEGTESIIFTLNSSPEYNLGSVSSPLSLIDNDIPTVNLFPGTNPQESGLTPGSFLLTFDQPANTDVTLFYTVNPTAATPGTDYNPLSGSVIMMTGQTTVTVDILPIDDTIIDPNETISLSLITSPTYNLGSNTTASVTLLDNESPGITILQTDNLTEVTEGSTTPDTYTLALNTDPISPVEITITADSQTEISTNNNSVTSTLTLTFTDTTPQTINIFAFNDTTVEGVHTGQITHLITNSSDPNYNSSFIIDPITVNILDNDTAPTPTPDEITNTLPLALDDSITTVINTPVTIPVLANDIDLDETDLIRIESFDNTTDNGGIITLDDNSTLDPEDDRLIYTPAENFLGDDTFSYTITDGQATSTATVSISVEFLALAPISLIDFNFTPRLPPLPNIVNNSLQAKNSVAVGTPNNDEIAGTEMDDLLFGLSNNDNIFGLEGNDRLYGNEGTDFLVGDIGADHLIGGLDDDALFGDQDRDLLLGGPGNDFILGGQNQDLLQGDSGDDYLGGDQGNDTIYGGQDNDIALGNSGDDVLLGNIGNDTLVGSGDNDSLLGGNGGDILSGETGHDTLEGGNDGDTLLGGVGNDCLAGGEGGDVLQGDQGNDTFFIPADLGIDTIYDFNPNEDILNFGDDLSLEQLEIMQMANGVVLKPTGSNQIFAHVLGITANDLG